MKIRSAVLAALLCAALCVGTGQGAGAQAPSVPPAFVTAQRLQAVSQAATKQAQGDIAHRRALQAVAKYKEVVASATYKHTSYAAESLFQEAQLEEKTLNDLWTADQAYQTLQNTLRGVSFPSMAQVAPEQKRLEDLLNTQNSTAPAGSSIWRQLGAGLYHVMDFLVALTGRQSYSYALAILMISILVKLALTPLSNKQYASMKEQQKLQPIIKEIQAKYKNDKEAQGRKVMEVYKEHGVNPAAGCITMLPTIPIMYLLYYMIRMYQFQFAHGSFLWIGSPLATAYPSYLGLNLGQPDIPILLLYALSMYVTQKMTITPALDAQQAEQQRMMAILTPFMSTYFFLQYHLPSAFILYYLIFNILSTAQQKYYMHKRAGEGGPELGGGSDGDGGSKTTPILPNGSGGTAKARPANGNGSNGNGSNGSRRVTPGREAVPLAEAKSGDRNGVSANGTAPTAKGVMAPKVHPKKKRR